jgi:hypothetical protein
MIIVLCALKNHLKIVKKVSFGAVKMEILLFQEMFS